MRLIYISLMIVACVFKSQAQVQPARTVVLILENRSYNQMVGNPDAPYINALMQNQRSAVMTRSFALARPSQPNYIMLFSGSAQGVASNNTPLNLPFTAPNLGASLIAKGLSFTGYSEDLPYVGFPDSAYNSYVRKHNPWVNWQGNSTNGISATTNRPFTDFPANYNLLPTVSFVIPNQQHDIHDGTVLEADTWIQTNLDPYVQWSINNNSLFILTFDEDSNNGLDSNRILTIFTGANIAGGTYAQPITHYNVLRTLEQLYQVPYAGASADSSAIQGIWLTTLPLTVTKFEAVSSSTSVLLTWKTNTASSIKSYTVERSTNAGSSFEEIGSVKGTVSNSYKFIDQKPMEGISLYRLKQLSKDNKVEYSKTIQVVRKSKDNDVVVSPNPAKDFINIYFKHSSVISTTIQLIDGAGKILKETVVVPDGQNSFKFLLGNIAKGTYYLNAVSGTKSIVKSIIVE
jgi:hypothetical protein